MRDILFVAGIALGLIITAAWIAFLALNLLSCLHRFFEQGGRAPFQFLNRRL